MKSWSGRNSKRPLPLNNSNYTTPLPVLSYRARTRELPDHYPFVVNKTFIDAVIRKWNTPAMDLCKTVHIVALEHVQKLVKQHFGSFGQGYLEQRVMWVVLFASIQL